MTERCISPDLAPVATVVLIPSSILVLVIAWLHPGLDLRYKCAQWGSKGAVSSVMGGNVSVYLGCQSTIVKASPLTAVHWSSKSYMLGPK